MENLLEIAKGAEANLLLDSDWNGVKVIIKKRNQKKYRNPELDSLIRRQRTIHEANIINRAKAAGVATPIIYQIDLKNNAIVMEFIDGNRVKDLVGRLNEAERRRLFLLIGSTAGLLHKSGIIHGDLTTSNIIMHESGQLVFIDFGLAEVSHETEKRGVDLNLMKRMLKSTHFKYSDELFDAFEEGYRKILKNEAEEGLERMREIERRGRYAERSEDMDVDE
jgi:TP53 regulating kinase-like protein